VQALHVGSLGLLLEPMATTISELVRRESAARVIVLDPNIRVPAIDDARAYRRRLDSVMAQSTIVKAAESDLAWLAPGAGVEEFAESILSDSGARLAVVTLGAQGAIGATARARARVAAPQVSVADTIGAGDAFGAALLAWLHHRGLLVKELSLDRSDLEDALTFACMAASMTCARAGADTPRRSELDLP
jgi:fructokinase